MTLIKVKVTDSTVQTRNGQGKNGKPYTLHTQDIIVELHDEIRKCPITLNEHGQGYPIGNYTIDPVELIAIGLYGFEFRRFHEIKLKPVQVNTLNMAKAV